MWFEDLFGFPEKDPQQVRNLLRVEGEYIHSSVNGKAYKCGSLEIPSLKELKQSVLPLSDYQDRLQLSELVGDVQQIHLDPRNHQAMIQAASQFNLLEMASPRVIPEDGVGIYAHDFTQGPACAIACGAGTVFRNYFVEVAGHQGQTTSQQINCLKDLTLAFGKEVDSRIRLQNGYAFADQQALEIISNRLRNCSPEEYESYKGALRIGIQWNAAVTIENSHNEVSQAYCSALPIGYSNVNAEHWEAFARLVLEATYEATFYVALKNYEQTGNNQLFLTLVGGGVFANEIRWITTAIQQTADRFRNTPLDVRIVSYRRSDPHVQDLVRTYAAR